MNDLSAPWIWDLAPVTMRRVGESVRDVAVVAAVPGSPGQATTTTAPPASSTTTTTTTTPGPGETPPTTEPAVVTPSTTVVPRGTTPAVTVTVPASQPRATAPPDHTTLPFTGGEAWALLWTAVAIIAIGAALLRLAKAGNRLGDMT